MTTSKLSKLSKTQLLILAASVANITQGAKTLGFGQEELIDSIESLPLPLIGALFLGLDAVPSSTNVDYIRNGCLHKRHQTAYEKRLTHTSLNKLLAGVGLPDVSYSKMGEPVITVSLADLSRIAALKPRFEALGFSFVPAITEDMLNAVIRFVKVDEIK